MPRGYSICPSCGASMSTNQHECPNCGTLRPFVATHPHAPIAAEQGYQVTRRGPYTKRGDWTISLVNGKKQIAATVSDAVAKRIIGMLF